MRKLPLNDLGRFQSLSFWSRMDTNMKNVLSCKALSFWSAKVIQNDANSGPNGAKWNPKCAQWEQKGCQNDAKIVREVSKWSLGRNVYFLEDFDSILGSLLAPKIYKFRIKSSQNWWKMKVRPGFRKKYEICEEIMYQNDGAWICKNKLFAWCLFQKQDVSLGLEKLMKNGGPNGIQNHQKSTPWDPKSGKINWR